VRDVHRCSEQLAQQRRIHLRHRFACAASAAWERLCLSDTRRPGLAEGRRDAGDRLVLALNESADCVVSDGVLQREND
jgi:hypothetical protein